MSAIEGRHVRVLHRDHHDPRVVHRTYRFDWQDDDWFMLPCTRETFGKLAQTGIHPTSNLVTCLGCIAWDGEHHV